MRVLAAMIVATMQVRERTLRAAMLDRLPAAEVRTRVRAVVADAFDRLAAAYGEIDRAR